MKKCEICGKVLDRAKARKYCSECARKSRKHPTKSEERRCVVCGKIITGRNYNAKYCIGCAAIAKKAQWKEKKISKLFNDSIRRNNEPIYGDKTQCITCEYYDCYNKICDYYSLTGMTRECEPSPNCEKYKKGERAKKTTTFFDKGGIWK